MAPAMAAEKNNKAIASEVQMFQKGVKHLCENGLSKLPSKYVLPNSERPDLCQPDGGHVLNVVGTVELPVIDFAELLGPNRRQVLRCLSDACQEFGFFQLINHEISSEVITNVREVCSKFFELPFEERANYMSSNMHATVRYGTSFNQNKDNVFCWRDFLKLTCNPNLEHLLPHWPSSPAAFRGSAAAYAQQTRGLFLMLVEAIQSAKLQKSLCCYNRNGDRGTDLQENNQLLDRNPIIDMRTVEHQIHILRMLEKSLAREMDLEKRLTETIQIDDELKLRLHSSQQDVYSLEEEVEDVCGRCFEAENASEVLTGVSKGLLGRLQLLQFSINGSAQREAELRLKFDGSMKQLKAKESELLNCKNNIAELKKTLNLQTDELKSKLKEAEEKLMVSNLETVTLKEKVSSLEKQLKESEEIEALKRRLRESDMKLQRAVASAEASQEKQTMLYAAINDMENLIRDLKLKVVKADSRADRAEENCILLTESYAEVNEELRLVRGRLDFLETSLQQAESRKKASAKNIDVRTKVITNLVMQVAIERDRLHKQISSLAMENKILAAKLKQANQDSVVTDHCNTVRTKEIAPEQDSTAAATTTTTCAREIQVDDTQLSAAGPEAEKTQDDGSVGGTTTNPAATDPDLETMRRIDIAVLSSKHVFILLSTLIIIAAVYLSKLQD